MLSKYGTVTSPTNDARSMSSHPVIEVSEVTESLVELTCARYNKLVVDELKENNTKVKTSLLEESL